MLPRRRTNRSNHEQTFRLRSGIYSLDAQTSHAGHQLPPLKRDQIVGNSSENELSNQTSCRCYDIPRNWFRHSGTFSPDGEEHGRGRWQKKQGREQWDLGLCLAGGRGGDGNEEGGEKGYLSACSSSTMAMASVCPFWSRVRLNPRSKADARATSPRYTWVVPILLLPHPPTRDRTRVFRFASSHPPAGFSLPFFLL